MKSDSEKTLAILKCYCHHCFCSLTKESQKSKNIYEAVYVVLFLYKIILTYRFVCDFLVWN